MSTARVLRPLQTVAVPMRDGRCLVLDLRETFCMPYLLAGEIWEEPGETHFVRHLVRSGDVAFDVGACVGWYGTLLADIAGPSGRVYAFEPNPAAFRLLALSARYWPQLIPVAAAAGNREGQAELHVPRDATMASLAPHPSARTSVVCPVVRLDRVWLEAGSPPVAFVKCDAEGAEHQVLAGAIEMLSRVEPPALMLELGPLSQELWGYRPEVIVAWLRDRFPGAYQAFRLHSQTGALEPLPEPITFRCNAVFLPAWAFGRLQGYRGC